MPYIAAPANMLIQTYTSSDRDRITPTYGPLCIYESVVLLPLKLCVKFEWSIVKHYENI